MTDDLDSILIHVKDALELAREKDEPRDMEIRFILALAVNELEAYRQEDVGYQHYPSSF
tara:strand:+ start:114 stop:290 length:177 start_codon:yes stop_codon:yes gene_type:complete